jgi:hypothetical protein
MPALMLSGMALENLLKSYMFRQGQPAASGGKLERTLRTHNLTELAARAGFTVTSEEEDLLARLTAFIVWAGRYPLATSSAAHAPFSPSGTAQGTFPKPSSKGTDRATFDALFARLLALVSPDSWL